MDHIFIERLWKTVKYEQVYLYAYDSVADARKSIMKYFEWDIVFGLIRVLARKHQVRRMLKCCQLLN